MPTPPGFQRVFRRPPIIGVVHLLPLPGSPGARPLREVVRRAEADTRTWFEAGADAVLVENFGDAPFHPGAVPSITVACLGRVLAAVSPLARGPVGVNVLRNDAEAGLSLAVAHELSFLRVNVHAGAMVTDQGLLQGQAHVTLRRRAELPGHPLILADVKVKHAAPLAPRPLLEEARELLGRAGADAVLLTGPATGEPAALEELQQLRSALPEAPLVLASGVGPDLLRRTRGLASGWIVGTYAKTGGRTAAPPSPARIRHLVAARDGSRG